ncbi:MAG TPA: quinol:cytochrome C oxidoreductase [Candidatus Kapabacteria bacterium]|nr:quinol:cytochrome C oxidoreductase [Candidatus Kapabacteria bacterium]
MSSDIILYEKKELPSKVTIIGALVLIVGIALSAVSFSVDNLRAYYNLILTLTWLYSIGLGAMFLMALEYVVSADWSVPFRRVTEIVAGLIFVVPIVSIPLLLNLDTIFVWLNPEILGADKYIAGKAPYLNQNFFIIRTIVVFLIMFLFYFLLAGRSLKQDKTKNASLTKLSGRISAAFMPIFAISITVVSMDWLMSLEPKWFSTIFGVYYFAGAVLAALSTITFVTIILTEKGYLSKYVTEDHYYNFGALLFAFVMFWAYIAFSQFMLIWYANIPDETRWYMNRGEDWFYVSIGLIFIKFIIPYLILLFRSSKSNPKILKFVSVWIFLAHYYDLYWMIMPDYTMKTASNSPIYSWFELSSPLIVIGLVIVSFMLFAKNKNLMPIGDPKFKKGLEFHL